MKRALTSPRVAKTKGPYVQGVAVSGGTLVFTSGVVARGVDGRIRGIGDIAAQTRQCLKNIENIIRAGGGSLRDLVKVTVFLRDLRDYAAMNEVRRSVLAETVFASSTVQAQLNAPQALIEIEAVAFVSAAKRS
ncbi:MAG: RidA family protein [Acidobacteria bacterium]|nr:RidA family protein [Acidobacteriota bacterium]